MQYYKPLLYYGQLRSSAATTLVRFANDFLSSIFENEVLIYFCQSSLYTAHIQSLRLAYAIIHNVYFDNTHILKFYTMAGKIEALLNKLCL